MVQAFEQVIEAATKQIAIDVKNGKNINMLLGAFNQWQEEECSGMNYIFDINNENDLKYLVNNGMITANGIAFVVNNYESGLFFFDGEVDAGMKPISLDKIKEYLVNNAPDYMPYVIMYVARCGENDPYSEVYETYIGSVLENTTFNPRYY